MSQHLPDSYKRYLQTKSLVDDIRWTISDSALKVSGSIDALQARGAIIERTIDQSASRVVTSIREEQSATRDVLEGGFTRIEAGLQDGFDRTVESLGRIDNSLGRIDVRLSAVDQTLRSGFYDVCFGLGDVSSKMSEMGALFDYRFSELQTSLGGMAETLEVLKRIAKSPEQTWALEQYEIAKDALQRELYEEALIFSTRAVEGHLSHTGYPLDHRFHYLIGIIRLGDRRNSSEAVVDLPAAEASFVLSAKYAGLSHRQDAARALCCAGQAAYWQNNVALWEKYTRAAIAQFGELPEGHFQLARIQLLGGKTSEGLGSLKRAIGMDELYSVKCFDFREYPEFRQHWNKVAEAIIVMTNELHDAGTREFRHLSRRISESSDAIFGKESIMEELKNQGAERLIINVYGRVRDWAAIRDDIDRVGGAVEKGGLPYIDATLALSQLRSLDARMNTSIERIRGDIRAVCSFLASDPFKPDPPPTIEKEHVPHYFPGFFSYMFWRAAVFISGVTIGGNFMSAGRLSPGSVLLGAIIVLITISGSWFAGEVVSEIVADVLNKMWDKDAAGRDQSAQQQIEADYVLQTARAKERADRFHGEMDQLDRSLGRLLA